jgi:hypothetical protein
VVRGAFSSNWPKGNWDKYLATEKNVKFSRDGFPDWAPQRHTPQILGGQGMAAGLWFIIGNAVS